MSTPEFSYLNIIIFVYEIRILMTRQTSETARKNLDTNNVAKLKNATAADIAMYAYVYYECSNKLHTAPWKQQIHDPLSRRQWRRLFPRSTASDVMQHSSTSTTMHILLVECVDYLSPHGLKAFLNDLRLSVRNGRAVCG